MNSKAKIWFKEIRAPFLTAVIIPVLLGTAIATNHGFRMNWLHFFLALIGAICIHAGINVANDYFDHRNGTDDVNQDFVSPFTGGSRVIQSGLLTPREVIRGAFVFLAIGSSIGLYLAFIHGPVILLIGVFGIVSGYFYSAPPFQLVNHGVGEFLIAIDFGLLTTLGAYYVQAETLALAPVIASIPISILISMVLFINEFQDYRADKQVGKNQWVVRLGRQKASLFYAVIMILTYLFVVLGVVLRITPALTLLGLLTLPMCIKAIKVARNYFDDPRKLTPANACTIQLHLLTGILMTFGYLLDYWI
jgi:1,4-dihydroxy-2-naphthoate octaprenyltransferase